MMSAMFIGHLAVGIAAKKAAPRTPLPALLLAAMLPDALLFLALLAPTVVFPPSHSLLVDAVCAALVAGVYGAATGYWRGAAWLAVLILSHWPLDLVSHPPDIVMVALGKPVGLDWVDWRTSKGALFETGMLAAALTLATTRG